MTAAVERMNVLVSHILGKVLVFRIYKEFSIKKSYNPINIWANDSHMNFTKEETLMANEHIER